MPLSLYQARHFVEPALINARVGMELVAQNGLHTGQRCVSCPFAQAVHAGVDARSTAQHGCQHIADGQIVVVVGMEVKVQVGESLHHLSHEADEVERVQNAQRVGQHEASYAAVAQCLHQVKHVLRTVLHAVAPVLQV